MRMFHLFAELSTDAFGFTGVLFADGEFITDATIIAIPRITEPMMIEREIF